MELKINVKQGNESSNSTQNSRQCELDCGEPTVPISEVPEVTDPPVIINDLVPVAPLVTIAAIAAAIAIPLAVAIPTSLIGAGTPPIQPLPQLPPGFPPQPPVIAPVAPVIPPVIPIVIPPIVPNCDSQGYFNLIDRLESFLGRNTGRPIDSEVFDLVEATNFCQVCLTLELCLKIIIFNTVIFVIFVCFWLLIFLFFFRMVDLVYPLLQQT